MHGILHAFSEFTKRQETKEKTSPGSIIHTTWKLKQILAKSSSVLLTNIFPGQWAPQDLQQIQCQTQLQLHAEHGMHHQKPQR